MNSQIEDLMDRAGLLADGCWDKMDDYTRQAIEKFAELIVQECAEVAYVAEPYHAYDLILKRFGLKGEK